ncbi:uncharacterized protein [Triticum aestivum]|uniref:uncharacterized protein n=1 Tax=Triticum aestivum TaxID=4565 RepID=UPI001D00D02B|nr:uncharacterized protein LOC123040753 [Triticum aestivum]
MGYFAPYGSPFPPPQQPRAPWTAPNSAGVLGPRPGQHHQVYNAGASSSSNPAPWDNYAALHAALNNIAHQQQHGSGEWFLDTGATSHVTGETGPQNPAHPNDVQWPWRLISVLQLQRSPADPLRRWQLVASTPWAS